MGTRVSIFKADSFFGHIREQQSHLIATSYPAMARLVIFLVAAAFSCGCIGAPQDNKGNGTIKYVVDHLVSGAEISGDSIKHLREAIEEANDAMRATEDKLQQITVQVETSEGESLAVIRKLNSVSKYIRIAGRNLVRVETQTRAACEQIDLNLEAWDGELDSADKKLFMEEQLALMEILMDDILEAFKDVSKTYGKAKNAVRNIDRPLKFFAQELKKKMHDTKEHEIRTTTSGRAPFSSVVDIATDLFSSVTPGLTRLLPPMKANKEKVSAKIRHFRPTTREVIKDLETFKDNTSKLIAILTLENEDSTAIGGWKNEVKDISSWLESAELSKFEELHKHKVRFSNALDVLKKSVKML